MQELLKSTQQHKEQTVSRSHLEATLAALQQQHQRLQDQFCDLGNQHRQLQQQHSSLQDQLSDSQHQYSQMEQQYLSSQEQVKRSAEDVESTQHQLEQTRRKMSTKMPQQLSLQADSCSPVEHTGHAGMQCQVTSYQSTPFWSLTNDTNTTQSMPSNAGTVFKADLLCLSAIQDAAEQLAVRTEDMESLTALSVSELHSLETACQAGLSNVVAAARHKALTEVLRLTSLNEQLERSAEDRRICPLCMESDKNTVLSCGHQTCLACCQSLTQCPFCSLLITTRTHIFQ